jgi:hypothetical protein
MADENGFGYIQNQSLDRYKQIIQFIAHENGLDASKTNPLTDANKLANI